MVLEQTQRSATLLLEDGDPPFLSESTIAVESVPASAQPMDKLVDFVYQWRVALVLGLIPILLGASALAIEPNPDPDPVLSGANASPLDALRQTIAATSEDVAVAASQEPSALVTSGRDPGQQDLGASSGAVSDESTAPDEESESTTTTTTAPSTTAQPPSTTEPPTTAPTTAPPTTTTAPPTTTTAPPTTSPPITVAQCLVEVRRRTSLRAEPSGKSDRIARVGRGTYAGFEREDGWFLIDYQGTLGWVNERSATVAQGEC